ncbi:hypothetical protein NDU88_004282 [Pleurodeles waltl]|uniref:Uncharacterized protein n=1 Tax=Pleurodeles waltl TaxID=8319 RepID=A0AAV7KZY5_PLEWA|nr:hypothetical protein NDU88_004282 [Pleurodeles waltl]
MTEWVPFEEYEQYYGDNSQGHLLEDGLSEAIDASVEQSINGALEAAVPHTVNQALAAALKAITVQLEMFAKRQGYNPLAYSDPVEGGSSQPRKAKTKSPTWPEIDSIIDVFKKVCKGSEKRDQPCVAILGAFRPPRPQDSSWTSLCGVGCSRHLGSSAIPWSSPSGLVNTRTTFKPQRRRLGQRLVVHFTGH